MAQVLALFLCAMMVLVISSSSSLCHATSNTDCPPSFPGETSGHHGGESDRYGGGGGHEGKGGDGSSGEGGKNGESPDGNGRHEIPKTCPINIVNIGVCSPLLGGGISHECCPLLGLLGVDIEICLCLALDVNVLGIIDINVPKLDIIANIMTTCGFSRPLPNFICP